MENKIWTVESSLVLLVVFMLTFWYIRLLWKRRYWYIHSWNAPGPLALPFVGAAYKFFGNPDDILEVIHKMMNYYPKLTKFWLGTRLIYLIHEPDHLQKVLSSQKCLDKDYFYKMISNAIGTGLLTAPVEKWKKHRKLIMPSFNQKILESFVEIFVEQTTIFTDVLKGYAGKKVIDINDPVGALTLDIICETAMGLKMNVQRGDCEFAMHLERIMEITTMRIFQIWYQFEMTWRLFPLSREFAEHCKAFHAVTAGVIKKKMDILEKKQENRRNSLTAQIDEGGRKKKLAFLDLILENSEFTKEELRDEVEIFLIAGTDTTSNTLCFFLEMMGMHPDIQQKVYEEAVDILGDRPVEVWDLPKFTYTERVLKETMRLFPIGAYFVRALGEDVDLGVHILPKGAAAFVGTVVTHRHPKYWPDPLKFDPDRFLPEQVANRHPCSFIPFSYGPRGCLGSKYAMMNMKTFAATALRKYRFFTHYKSVEEIKLKTKIVLRPKDGFKVYLEVR